MYKFPDLVYKEIPGTMMEYVNKGNKLLNENNFADFMSTIVYQA